MREWRPYIWPELRLFSGQGWDDDQSATRQRVRELGNRIMQLESPDTYVQGSAYYGIGNVEGDDITESDQFVYSPTLGDDFDDDRPGMLKAQDDMTADDTFYPAIELGTNGYTNTVWAVQRPNGVGVSNGDIGFLGRDLNNEHVFIPARGPSTSGGPTPIIFQIGNGSNEITPGAEGWVQIEQTGTLTEWSLLADQTGSITVDVWKDTYTNYPPTDADSITNGHEPSLSSAQKAEDTDLTDWSAQTVNDDDVLKFYVDSATTVTKVQLELMLS